MFFVTGKIVNKSLIKNGVSDKGSWKIITFLIEKTKNKKKIKLPFTAKGSLAEKVSEISLGQKVRVEFYIVGREYNGRYYPDVIATDIEKYVNKKKSYPVHIGDETFVSSDNFLNSELQLFKNDENNQ